MRQETTLESKDHELYLDNSAASFSTSTTASSTAASCSTSTAASRSTSTAAMTLLAKLLELLLMT